VLLDGALYQQKNKKQAQREGGQFLILSPNNGSAAALSALPSNLHGKGSKNSGTAKGNGENLQAMTKTEREAARASIKYVSEAARETECVLVSSIS